MLESLLTANAEWICLQTEVRESDRAAFYQFSQISRFAEGPADFADTAAIIANLDLVITVDTSVAHLAGALGRPTWILLRFDTDWRWGLEADTTHWYPSARLYRQTVRGDWSEPLARIGVDLAAKLRQRAYRRDG